MSTKTGVRSAWLLGLAGLIPFAVGAAGTCVPLLGTTRVFAADALCDYAACILSFIGGIRWGADVRRGHEPQGHILALSVLPSLVGWGSALMGSLTGYRWAFVLLIAAFSVQGAWDIRSAALPEWMGRLRAVLTLGAVAALLVALIAS